MSTSQFDYWCISQYSSTLFRTPVCLFLCVQRETTSHPGETVGGKKKIGFSLHSSSSANTDIVKQSAKHFALRGWTSGGTIIMTHFSLSLLDSSVTRGVLGMRNQASLFNGTRATAIRPFLFPRVPWVMEKVTVTRIELLRLLRTDIEHKKTVVIACCL